MEQIFPAHWTHLSHDVREHLAKVFGIGRSAGTEIVDNRIISDGRSVNDLKAVTKEKMQEYLNGSKEEVFARLWELSTSKAMGEVSPAKDIKAVAPIVDKPVDSGEKKVDAFRPATEKEKEVFNIINKNANDKSKPASKK